ncbi:MAG TPA: hypothetical protein VD970_17315, partial [Acetobacteraceae bacterium]|nr:hypothetical protein [Acetobacteraceae bacterium]
PPQLVLPGPQTMPSVLPVSQDRLVLNAAPRLFTVPQTGWTTELQLEGSGTFNPLKPDKGLKTEVEITANLYRLGFLGKKGEFDVGAKITPFESPLVRGVANVQVKPFKWEHEMSGLTLAIVMSSALTVPPAELETKLAAKAEWEWTKPLGAPKGLEGRIGLWAGSKFVLKQDENSAFAAQFYPFLIGAQLSISIGEERHKVK